MLRPRRCFCCLNYLKSRDTDAYLTFLVFRFNHWNKKPFCSNNNNIKNSACKCQILCFYACIGAITCTQSIWYMFLKKYKSMLSTDDHNTTLLTFFSTMYSISQYCHIFQSNYFKWLICRADGKVYVYCREAVFNNHIKMYFLPMILRTSIK